MTASAGVVLYSVALVAVPGFLSGAGSRDEALRRAAWIFAIAGWVGSAMGVGMGENLHRVPGCFVGTLWALVVLGWMMKRSGALRLVGVEACMSAIVWLVMEPEGRGNGVLARRLGRPPANLVEGPFVHTAGGAGTRDRWLRIARVVKFGVPGTDMPGHELLNDGEVALLADWLLELRGKNEN